MPAAPRQGWGQPRGPAVSHRTLLFAPRQSPVVIPVNPGAFYASTWPVFRILGDKSLGALPNLSPSMRVGGGCWGFPVLLFPVGPGGLEGEDWLEAGRCRLEGQCWGKWQVASWDKE